MRSKLFILVSVLVLSLGLSACAGVANDDSATPRNLSVSGYGQVSVTPDVVYVYIGVHTEDADIAQAVERNREQSQAVIDTLGEFGVAEKDMQTSNFSIWPSQQYDYEGQLTGTIYYVDNTVYVTVHEMDKLEELLQAAITAGANTINSIQFDLSDKTQALSEARQLAMENTLALAEELAESANVQLGDVQTITYYDTYPYYGSYGYGIGGGGGGGMEVAPIAPGQINISVNITVVYEIK